MTTLFASDLDRTLIYSAGALQLGRPVAEPVLVEVYDGQPTSFADPAALAALRPLADHVAFVPTTTRTRAQYERIQLAGVRVEHAVTTNGAVLLVDGEPCGDWAAETVVRMRAGESYADVRRAAEGLWRHPWVLKVRDAEGVFFYAVVDPALTPQGWYDEVAGVAAWGGWQVSVQGRKVYLIPPGVTKEAAVAEVARRVGAERVAAAGDSLLDRGMLVEADLALRPSHGELHEEGWSVPGLHVTRESGGPAATEIVETVARWSAAGAAVWSTVASDIGP
ncbi:HAD family hydrolase [Nocardioides zeae]|uniref:HAD family hydrolase n=1 Tax=Nocardioides imazamoxiresistens TaxID=3231893 RepID=A0ABU3PYI8_9ACTN|nr:HAD family hydrolase [Nocardioides zeae]MDT9594333.1 HAD family hydrolase [Nocardioides zeae]